jgi:CysZ protein
LKEIVIAFRSWQEARHFIQQHNLLRGILWPGILYTLLSVLGLILFMISSNEAVSWMSQTIGIEQWLQKERSEWLSFLFVMNGMMLRLVLLLFYFALFKNLILIVGAPGFAYLSEKTEALLENKEHHFQWNEVWKDAQRGIRLAIRNTGLEALYFTGVGSFCRMDHSIDSVIDARILFWRFHVGLFICTQSVNSRTKCCFFQPP